MRVLIIDNYDSYTFNLYQYFCISQNHPPVVIRNDQFDWPYLLNQILPSFDVAVISPGPGRPERVEDFGVCFKLLEECPLPILGVCLGHQGAAYVFGGKVLFLDIERKLPHKSFQVIHASEPVHGRISPIYHSSSSAKKIPSLFDDIPSPFNAVRYHSLIVSDEPNSNFKVTAWTYDPLSGGRIIMGMEHTEKPIWSQSICTEHGRRLISNFMTLAALNLGSNRSETQPMFKFNSKAYIENDCNTNTTG
ncbi:hypothetical protein HK096_006143 [Nowakowskiella sp. JEL0078]|nr:hypothetical protein HK096_006143 [Nowakowskiella sp. JEL0078]